MAQAHCVNVSVPRMNVWYREPWIENLYRQILKVTGKRLKVQTNLVSDKNYWILLFTHAGRHKQIKKKTILKNALMSKQRYQKQKDKHNFALKEQQLMLFLLIKKKLDAECWFLSLNIKIIMFIFYRLHMTYLPFNFDWFSYMYGWLYYYNMFISYIITRETERWLKNSIVFQNAYNNFVAVVGRRLG